MLTDKEKMELLNLRKRIVAQRDEIKRLQEQVKHPEGTSKGRYTTMKTEERVLNYMRSHGSIDQQRANRDLGCSRLAEYIRRLKKSGVAIADDWKTGENRFGEPTRWKEYRIA